ncbi:hypothetical protein REPUB_Repub15cG0062500 [Reevesia pubescens]
MLCVNDVFWEKYLPEAELELADGQRLAMDHPAARTAPKMVKESSKPMQQPTVVVSRKEKQPKKSIFTLGSPERKNKSKKLDEGFGVFLQACSLCKKNLKPDKDIYMYGYLGAFCTADCRDDRIALDGLDSLDKEVSIVPINMRASKRF